MKYKYKLIEKLIDIFEYKDVIEIENHKYYINWAFKNIYIVRDITRSKRFEEFADRHTSSKYGTWLAEFGLYETYMLLYTYLDQLPILNLERLIYENII